MRLRARRLLCAAALSALSLGVVGAVAVPTGATAATAASNPLRGTLGVYDNYNPDPTGISDNMVYQDYFFAKGKNKQLLARLAERPRVQWFTTTQDAPRLRHLVQKYIAHTTGGNRNVVTQLAEFGIPNWENGNEAMRQWSDAEIAAYHHWVDVLAGAIGNARTVVILQPDLLYAVHNFHPLRALAMVAYAAKKLGALRNTYVYVDAGSSDWRPTPKYPQYPIARTLALAGIRYTNGFSLDDTHHASTNDQLAYGASIAASLTRMRLPHHFVVNTAGNAVPTTGAQLSTLNDPPECTATRRRVCVALGIPPTTDTSNAHWGLTGRNRAIAAKLCDAYLWVDRPWMTQQDQGGKVPLARSLHLAEYTPFIASTPRSSRAAPVRVTDHRAGSYVVANTSRTQNLTIDGISFNRVSGGVFTNSPNSTCKLGGLVAPRSSCTVTVRFASTTATSRRPAMALLMVDTNTANAKWKRLIGTP